MSIGIGGGTSNSPQIQGVDGGAHIKSPIQNKFNDEFAPLFDDPSEGPGASAKPGLADDSESKTKSAFNDNNGSAAASDKKENPLNPFSRSPTFMDVARALAHHLLGPQESNSVKGASESMTASAGTQHYKGLPDLVIRANTGNAAGTARVLDTGTHTRTSNYSGTDTNTSTGRQSDTAVNSDARNLGLASEHDLMRFRPNPADTRELHVDTKDGPVTVNLNPLRATNGETVRAENGQPLVESMSMRNDRSGRTGLIDFTDTAMARSSGVPQQGLITDVQKTITTPGLVVMHRQDGARIAYQPYQSPDNSQQARVVAVSSQDGTREYIYGRPEIPGLATAVIDNVRNIDGSQLTQMRVRDGISETFQVYDLQTQYGQKAWVYKETERYVQTRMDGQIVYHLQPNYADLAQRARNGEFDNRTNLMGQPVSRQEILNKLLSEKSQPLVANDLASSKRALLDAFKDSSGRCRVLGSEAKASAAIDKYLSRIQWHRQQGNKTASDDQLALSLRKIASVFTNARQGTAAKMTDKMLIAQTEDMLRSMGNPIRENNQGQIGSCYVNSYRIVAEYAFPHMVIDKWCSIMSTGRTKDGKAKFSTAELMTRRFRGTTPFDYIMTSACWKKRTGANSKLDGMNSGTHDGQAIPEYRWLTGGGKLPHSEAEAKRLKTGAWIFFQPGHARTKIKTKTSSGKSIIFANNTWDGSGESGQKEPVIPITTLPC